MIMGTVRVISTCSVYASTLDQNDSSPTIIHLTPWDLQIPARAYHQQGLLFRNPKSSANNINNIIENLKHSLSRTLNFFLPLSGRLTFDENLNDNTCSVSILCNNAGALFVHAMSDDTTVSDILHPTYVPPIVHQFFHLTNNDNNDTCSSNPILAVQVTRLVDGYFIACSMNHCVADGMSFWHFFNSWAEISRGLDRVSKVPVLERWFPNGVDPPIRIPNNFKQKQDCDGLISSESHVSAERVFHFTKEKIGELKAKVKAELNDNKITISSLQAVLSHIWRCIVRNQRRDAEEEVRLVFAVGVRQRIVEPALGDNYFGNAMMSAYVSMKAEELVKSGVGKGALEINKTVGLHTEKMLKSYYECWIKEAVILKHSNMRDNSVVLTSSPKFDIYVNDFGWGQPVAVRSGPMRYPNGNLTLCQGAEEGSIDVDVCIGYRILEAMEKDSEFMHAVSL